MTVFVHVVHTIRPISADIFDRWVDFYGEAAVPAMERSGFDVLGGWKLGTGRMHEDLVLSRFESLADYEKAYASLGKDKKMADALGKAFSTGMEIEEHVTFARPVSYAEERLLEAALAAKPDKPRQYLLATLPLKLGKQAQALDTIAKAVDIFNKGNTLNLVTAYEATSGRRGMLNDIWVMPNGMWDLSYRRGGPNMDELLKPLREVAPEESVTFMNPLPYSRLQ